MCVKGVFAHRLLAKLVAVCVKGVFAHRLLAKLVAVWVWGGFAHECLQSWSACVIGAFLHTEISFIRGAAGSVGDVGKGRGFPSRLLDG